MMVLEEVVKGDRKDLKTLFAGIRWR